MTNPLENNSSLKGFFSAWSAPNRATALQQYRSRAPLYDLQAALAEPLRRRAVDRLRLNRGAVVIDAGCGTGLSFAALEEAIGRQGAIIGIEMSPSMIEQARTRAARHGWDNVTLLDEPVEEALIPLKANAALFCFTHDVMRSPDGVKHVVNHLKPGARVVSVGLKWAAPCLLRENMMVWGAALASMTTLEGLSKPWSHLEKLVPQLRVEEFPPGTVYLATGIFRTAA